MGNEASAEKPRSYGYDPMSVATSSISIWEPKNGRASIQSLEGGYLRQAVLVWVVLPVFVAVQELLPFTQPTCSHGFSNWGLIVLAVVELHHIFAESQCWAAAKELLAPPELSVLRQLQILRNRSRYVLLGILEVVDVYTDFSFPFIVLACDELTTERWSEAWAEVPLVGAFMSQIVRTMRFWGITLVIALINISVTGLYGLWKMKCNVDMRKQKLDLNATGQFPRISGEVFFGWAQSAETAMMPSVAMLCEEMASQKMWQYDASKDTSQATQARANFVHDKIDQATLAKSEINNFEEEDRVRAAGTLHYLLLLFVKVFIGNALSLWFQGSFLALTFELTAPEARIKVIISMCISTLQALVRCCTASDKLGLPGLVMSIFIMLFIGWSFVKVYHAYTCPDHVWNLTTGCVESEHAHHGDLYFHHQ